MRMCVAISKVRRILTLLLHNAKLNLFKNQHSFQRQKVFILSDLCNKLLRIETFVRGTWKTCMGKEITTMKLFHLSDLHIGKIVNGYEMWEDQRYVFDQILAYVREEQPDAVMIAGDIYDKAVPSAKAVTEFDEFLTELADSGTIILIISGNHDSAERLDFASSIMKKQNIYMKGTYGGEAMKVTLQDKWGDVNFYLMPFVKPSNVKNTLSDLTEEPEKESAALTYTEAMQQAVAAMQVDPGKRNVLIAHQNVTNSGVNRRSDSETISIGGLDNIDRTVFDIFDYVALGHLHSPQQIGKPEIRYCGTPVIYSMSEADDQKSVTVVELGEKGKLSIRELPLNQLHAWYNFTGTLDEAMSREANEDYARIVLTDKETIIDVQARLRTVYKNLMSVEFQMADGSRPEQERTLEDVKNLAPDEAFADFYNRKMKRELSDENAVYIRQLIRDYYEQRQG